MAGRCSEAREVAVVVHVDEPFVWACMIKHNAAIRTLNWGAFVRICLSVVGNERRKHLCARLVRTSLTMECLVQATTVCSLGSLCHGVVQVKLSGETVNPGASDAWETMVYRWSGNVTGGVEWRKQRRRYPLNVGCEFA